ncbi:MAG: AAA family ATPase [Opitutaceae bacterium]|nr:AAA family ATPase [Opitutaceae bacterium]
MYSELEITHFRAFSHLTIKPLRRVNLIAGDNNIGKTGILEAIWLATDNNPWIKNVPALFRRSVSPDSAHSGPDDADNFWLWLYHQRDTSKPWTITLFDSISGNSQLEVRFTDKKELHAPVVVQQGKRTFLPNRKPGASKSRIVTVISTRFASPTIDAELVNAVALRNEEDELIEYLQHIEPRLRKLKYLKLPGHQHPYVYADIGFGKGKELIPATQLGQGFSRLLTLFATIMTSGTKILLIDEFENGLQHDALEPVWKSLAHIAQKRDIQIFATTHSYECIQAAHQAFSKNPDTDTSAYDLGIIKLQRPDPDAGIEAVVMDREMIDTALARNLEVR